MIQIIPHNWTSYYSLSSQSTYIKRSWWEICWKPMVLVLSVVICCIHLNVPAQIKRNRHFSITATSCPSTKIASSDHSSRYYLEWNATTPSQNLTPSRPISLPRPLCSHLIRNLDYIRITVDGILQYDQLIAGNPVLATRRKTGYCCGLLIHWLEIWYQVSSIGCEFNMSWQNYMFLFTPGCAARNVRSLPSGHS